MTRGGAAASRRRAARGEGLDALRRRVYGAQASDEDVERYRRALGRSGDDHSAARPDGRGLRRRRGTMLLLAGGLVATVVLVVALHRAAPAPPSASTQEPRATPRSVPLPIAADTRADFVRSLEQGRGAGLARYFFQHPEARPAEVTTLTRAATEEHHGIGAQAVDLVPSELADRGGRVTVMLTLAREAPAAWRLVRSPGADLPRRAGPVGARRSDQLAGLPVSATVAYRGVAPDRLLVAAPVGVRWDAVVVFSN